MQALTTSGGDASNLYVKYYYDHNNGQAGYGLGNPGDWLFNPAPGTPDYGKGMATDGFAQLTTGRGERCCRK